MAVNYTDFDKIWASASPLTPYEFSENNYKAGWNFVGATPPSRQMWDAFMKNADEKLQYLYHHEDIPLGHEYFTFNPNVPQGSLPLFGGEYSRETYSDLWAWVQTQTGYLKTEAEWQTLSASNNGNVPYYSDGDGSTTFRVPSLKCWVKAANGTVSEVGSYLEAGLPNITGKTELRSGNNYSMVCTGVNEGSLSIASKQWSGSHDAFAMISTSLAHVSPLSFDASASNSIYGNSTTVQPPSIVGMWLVKAYGVIVDTGTIDEQQYIDDRFAAAKDYTDMEVETGVPTGCVQAFAGQTTPNGWLLCDGSAVSRVTYAKLFSVIGTSYGSGDGTSTFNLPNLIDKFVEGSVTSGTVKSAGLPNITGQYSMDSTTASTLNNSLQAIGAFTKKETLSDGSTSVAYRTTASPSDIAFDASLSNSIYGGSTTVQPPALTMQYIIKY